jgi:putative transcriptional regulator
MKKIKDEFEHCDTSKMTPLGRSGFQALRQALAYQRGQLTQADGIKVHRYLVKKPKFDIKAIRAKLGLTQEEFALLIHASVRAVQHWEQKTRKPDGPTCVLLQLLARNPQMVWDTLQPTSA